MVVVADWRGGGGTVGTAGVLRAAREGSPAFFLGVSVLRPPPSKYWEACTSISTSPSKRSCSQMFVINENGKGEIK